MIIEKKTIYPEEDPRNPAFNYKNSIMDKVEKRIKIQLLKDEHFKAILSQLGKYRKDLNTIEKVQLLFIQILLPFVADYGIYHPTKYIWARSELYWWQIVECPKRILSLAQKEHYKLINGFRSWIGPNRKLANNRNDDSEYNWKDVIIFDELIEPAIQEALLNAITNKTVTNRHWF